MQIYTKMKLTADNTRLVQIRDDMFELRWTEPADITGTGKPRTQRRRFPAIDRTGALIARDDFFRLQAGQLRDSGSMTVRELFDAYREDHMKVNDIKPTQHYSLLAVERTIGDRVVTKLDAPDFRLYRQLRAEDGIASGTMRRELGALRAAISWGQGDGGVLPRDWNPPHIKLPQEGAPRDVWLREAEAERTFELAQLEIEMGGTRLSRVGRFVCIALESAARSESIERLEWDRVDLSARLIDFRERGKRVTKKRRVAVPISDKLLPVLQRAYDERTGPYVMDHQGDNSHAWERFRDKVLGYTHIVRHDLRRTWATLAARRGVDLYQIAGVLGDDIKTVERHYAHHSPDYLRGAM